VLLTATVSVAAAAAALNGPTAHAQRARSADDVQKVHDIIELAIKFERHAGTATSVRDWKAAKHALQFAEADLGNANDLVHLNAGGAFSSPGNLEADLTKASHLDGDALRDVERRNAGPIQHLLEQALAAKEAALRALPKSAALGCTLALSQSIVAAADTEFTISGCNKMISKIVFSVNGMFTDRSEAAVEQGSSFRVVDCGHGAGVGFQCVVNAPPGSTIVEDISGLKPSQVVNVLAYTISPGKFQAIHRILPPVRPPVLSMQITAGTAPYSYQFHGMTDKPLKQLFFSMPGTLQLREATNPAGLTCGSQLLADGTGRIVCTHVGPGAAPAGNLDGSFTFNATWPSPVTVGAYGTDPFSSSTTVVTIH
jgi:hypothetical protein